MTLGPLDDNERLTDAELVDLYAAHCECRPVEIGRTYHSHDCGGEHIIRAIAELHSARKTILALSEEVAAKQRGYEDLHEQMADITIPGFGPGGGDIWSKVDRLIKRLDVLEKGIRSEADGLADEAQTYELGPLRADLYRRSDRLRALLEKP